jgi:hypothetical protein
MENPIPKIIDGFAEIGNAYFDTLRYSLKYLPKETIERTKQRLNVCYNCEYRKQFTCGKCGCPIRAKVMSQKGCPMKQW